MPGYNNINRHKSWDTKRWQNVSKVASVEMRQQEELTKVAELRLKLEQERFHQEMQDLNPKKGIEWMYTETPYAMHPKKREADEDPLAGPTCSLGPENDPSESVKVKEERDLDEGHPSAEVEQAKKRKRSLSPSTEGSSSEDSDSSNSSTSSSTYERARKRKKEKKEKKKRKKKKKKKKEEKKKKKKREKKEKEKEEKKKEAFSQALYSPARRWLALRYCNLVNKEVEYLTISRDTTEADIKVRREISGGTVHWINQSSVNAAIHGRTLILDGIEKAERNVLPILNNLLENREMALDDGRFLMHHQRYDTLLEVHGQEEMDRLGYLRVSPAFRVIALGLPVPPYAGTPLDPPLRSRFQCMAVDLQDSGELLGQLIATAPAAKRHRLEALAKVLEEVLEKFETQEIPVTYLLKDIAMQSDRTATLTFTASGGADGAELQAYCGPEAGGLQQWTPEAGAAHQEFVALPFHQKVLSGMCMDHVAGHHICLISENGNGKTSLAHRFCRQLGYAHSVHTVQLYSDMTTRDLLQRRVTNEAGDTVWQCTALMQAAKDGGVAILDGVDKLKPGCLAYLQRLLVDGEVALYDGGIFKTQEEFDLLRQKLQCSEEELNAQKIYKVHKSFRVIALASSSAGLKWLQHESQCMFSYHYIRPLSLEETKAVAKGLNPALDEGVLDSLMRFSEALSDAADRDTTLHPLSLRQILRIARHLALHPKEVRSPIAQALMYPFLPLFHQQKLDKLFEMAGLPVTPAVGSLEIRTNDEQRGQELVRTLSIGDTSLSLPRMDVNDSIAHTLVPSVLFYDNPKHIETLQNLMKSYKAGDHLLLIGNQGVGKNKLADRLLQLLCLPRHYIQLHRDTTVQSLTVSPSVVGGVLHWEDSPLVKAVSNGHVLVVDEVDKAPVEVVGVLKGLVEDRHMLLADGRQIVGGHRADHDQGPSVIHMHPRFRLIALANRPGYPFLGNDFFANCGDLFSCHSIENPDAESIRTVLRKYGPSLGSDTIELILETFARLGALVEKGILSYPYSLREMVNVVKHLERFPSDSIAVALNNVFHFEQHDATTYRVISDLFKQYGIALAHGSKGPAEKLDIQFHDSPTPPETAGDLKHGKVDPDNTPHVGGNQWAGGTGGTDTAGLGGRVGPYRLDAGHPVHQVSDEEKASVPEEIKAKARAMGKEALQKRLAEIQMTKSEDNVYQKYYDDVTSQISILKEMLKGMQSKQMERTWLKNQTEGVWDENKLVEGLTGEKTIFKRRSDDPDTAGWTGEGKKKRMMFVLDVSASMYRFNGVDGRLDRILQVAVMIMEAFHGYEDKIYYGITGHSGDEERLRVMQQMYAHAQYCWTGDNTVGAIRHTVETITKEEASDYFVFVVSDANFQRYGIRPSEVAAAMTHDPNVKTFCIFIASLWNEAQKYCQHLPVGQSFVCLDPKDLPNILRQIFLSAEVIK